MTEQHPITPPPELVRQWITEGRYQDYCSTTEHAIAQAARWGADMELEACCEWLDIPNHRSDRGDGWLMPRRLRAARRPKPQSLAEEAHGALGRFFSNAHTQASQMTQDFEILRRAVERLQELENNG